MPALKFVQGMSALNIIVYILLVQRDILHVATSQQLLSAWIVSQGQNFHLRKGLQSIFFFDARPIKIVAFFGGGSITEYVCINYTLSQSVSKKKLESQAIKYTL